MLIRIGLTVDGEERMHCGACENRVRFALSRLPGVHGVEANAKTQHISVMLDDALTSVAALQERLVLAGFKTSRHPSSPNTLPVTYQSSPRGKAPPCSNSRPRRRKLPKIGWIVVPR